MGCSVMIRPSSLCLTVILAGIAVFSTGCKPELVRPSRAQAPPVPAQCAAQCTASCLPAAWPRWEGDPDDPTTWDRLASDVLSPLRDAVEVCDVARATCVACLRRLERAHIICGVAEPCSAK